jgi:RNA polymerase sigma factor (sigma-70 family)
MKPSTGSLDNEEWAERQNPFAQGISNDSTILDEELVAKAQAGDRDALERLVRRHQGWVFNIALRMMWRRDLAEDATQEILIKVVTKLSTFRAQSQFRTWLYRIAINHVLNLRKSEIEQKLSTFTDSKPAKVFSFDEIQAAHQLMESGKAMGKSWYESNSNLSRAAGLVELRFLEI